jgi:uncharacterized cupredoxin-like copper-binding protein
MLGQDRPPELPLLAGLLCGQQESPRQLDEHAALMLKVLNTEHEAPYLAHVAGGKSGQVVWTFNRAGDLDFACLIAGHYQVGMVGKIRVAAR